jgi:hypothetical protein
MEHQTKVPSLFQVPIAGISGWSPESSFIGRQLESSNSKLRQL